MTSWSADGLILRLQPLSERAVAVLLHVELGHAVDARFAAALHRATGGRPLLVHELAVAARRARVLDSEDGEAWLASALPPAVVDFAARCLCVAAPPARALAPALALLGTRGSLHQAAALAGLAPDEAVTGCDGLREAGLLDGAAIAPPLLARALYAASHPPAERACTPGPRVSVARRTTCCEAIPAPTHGWSRRSGAWPSRRWMAAGPQDAAALLRRAAREGVSGERADLLLELARAEQRLADGNEIARLEAALESGAPRTRVTGPLARALLTHGRAVDALALVDADPAEFHAGARLQPGAGAAAAARLKAAAGDSSALLACRAAEAVCAASSAETATALAREALDDPALDPEGPAFFLACAALAWSDRLMLARSQLERALAHAGRIGSVGALVRAEVGLAGVALRAGDVDGAVVHATTALGAGRGTALALPARAVLVLALTELDRLEDASAACDASTPELRFARGHLHLIRCDRPAARRTCWPSAALWRPTPSTGRR